MRARSVGSDLCITGCRRRALVNKEDAGRFIFDERHSKDYWEGKRVYLAIFSSDPSKEAEKEYEKIEQRESRRAAAENLEKSVLNFYENWPELPLDATLVNVWFRPRKKVAVVGDECYRRLPALDVNYFLTEKGESSSLQIVQVETGLGEFPFGEREVAAIEEKLNEKVDGITRVHHFWKKKPKYERALAVPFSALFGLC